MKSSPQHLKTDKKLERRSVTESTGGLGLEPGVLRGGGRTAKLVEARRRFIWRAVFEQGYRASDVAVFSGSHASNVSRVLQGAKSAE